MNKINYNQALQILKDGNRRYANNLISINSISHQEKRSNLAMAQSPYAIILSCSDSRVPSEIVFDQGLGDLFVIRVAGNIVAPSLIGSIEFAASTFGTELVVVMGHSQCGAVSAALDVELSGHKIPSENIRDIVDRISPSIRPEIQKSNELLRMDRDKLLEKCIQANIQRSIHNLKNQSHIISDLINKNKLYIIGAEYCLKSGIVHFFEPDDKLKLKRLRDREAIIDIN